MANYCVAGDVKVALGYIDDFSSDSRPTLTEVNTIITDTTNEIDFYLKSVGINTQPTDSTILGRLSKACIYGSSGNTGLGYLNNSADVVDTLAEYYLKKYQEILDEIKEKPELYGLVVDSNAIYAQNQVTDGTMTEAEFAAQSQDSDYEV